MPKNRIGFSNELVLVDGNIGIGTTNPTSKFSVVTASTGDTILQIGDNTSSGSMFRVNNSVGYPLMDVDGDGTILFTTPGNIGIGATVTSPAYKLDVGGDTNIRNNLSIGGSVSIGGTVGVSSIYATNAGISSNLYVGGTITVGNAKFGSNINIAGSMTAASFYGSGIGLTGVLLGQFTAPGFPGQMVFNDNSLISATPLYFYDAVNTRIGVGTTVPTSRFSVVTPLSGDNILQIGDNTSSGSMFRVNSSTGYPLMDVDGDGTILFTTPGNIGIGATVTSPAYKLDVGGDTNIRNNLSIGGSVSIGGTVGIGSNLYVGGTITVGNANFGTNISIAGSVTANNFVGFGSGLIGVKLDQLSSPGFPGQMVFNNNNLISATPLYYYDAVNTRIGIGTTIPTSRFSVVTPSTGDTILQIGDNTSSGSMFRVNNSVGYPLMDIDGDGTILFLTTGNVGIGSNVTSPAYKLEVGGNTNIQNNLSVGGNVSISNNLSVGGNITIGSANFGTNISIAGTMTAATYYGSGAGLTSIGLNQLSSPGFPGQMVFNNNNLISATPLYYYDAVNTRIGIGTTIPTSRFSVVTPSTGDTILQIGDNTSSGSMFRVNNSTGYPLMDIDGDGTILFLTTGNIGISSTITAPAYKLEVSGDIKVGVNTSQGLILTSPNGTKYRIIVDNAGALSTAIVI